MSSDRTSSGAGARRLAVIVAIGTVGFVACAPPPPPPPPGVCGSTSVTSTNYGAFVTDKQTGQPDVVEFQANSSSDRDTQVNELKKTKNVHAVSAEQPVQKLAVNPADDTHYAEQWGFEPQESDFPGAWNDASEPAGAGIRVAVVDTGVQQSVPDLSFRVLQGQDFVFGSAASNYGRKDGDGHGTHVAGTIAAKDNTEGVVGGAPSAWIVPVRVLDCNGNGSSSDVAEGITWAANPAQGNADVISLSLGGGADPVEEAAINYALSKGVTVVAAAGNLGATGAERFPAAYPGVMAVGAKDEGAGAVHFDDGTVSTPGTAQNALETNGAFELVTRVEPGSWTPSGNEALASKLGAASGYEPLALTADGRMTMTTPAGVVSSPPHGLTGSGRRWLKVLRANNTVTFYTAPDASSPPATWTLVPDTILFGGGTVSTPHSAANSLSGTASSELIIRVQADSWTPAARQVLASKYDLLTNTGYELALKSDGKLEFLTGVGTQTLPATSTSAVAGEARSRRWLRVRRQTASGVSTVSFATAPDSIGVPASWTSLGSQTIASTSPFAPDLTGTVDLVLGNRPIPAGAFAGSVPYMELRNNVGGTQVAVMNATSPAAGAASWVSATGEWSVHAPAAVMKGSTPSTTTGFTRDDGVPFVVGDRPDGSRPFHGFVLYSQLRDVVASSTVLVMDPATQAKIGDTTLIASTGNWTVSSGADVTGRNASYSNANGYVAVIAPGSNVISTFNTGGYGYLSGTSMATPHVTAVVALILHKCFSGATPADLPPGTPQLVREWITSSSVGPFAGFRAFNEDNPTQPVGLLKAGAAYEAAGSCV